MDEINKIFSYAMRAFTQTVNNNNQVGAIGIAFANSTYPQNISRLLKEAAEKYILRLEACSVILRITGLDAIGEKVIFVTEVNYFKPEFDAFKASIRAGDSGAFVIGAVYNRNFRILTDDKEDFKPFQVSKFLFE